MRGAIPVRMMTMKEARELFPDPPEWSRPGGIVSIDDPCACEICRIQQDVEATRDQIDRIMAGVDMPGRIVDDVRPDQRGES